MFPIVTKPKHISNYLAVAFQDCKIKPILFLKTFCHLFYKLFFLWKQERTYLLFCSPPFIKNLDYGRHDLTHVLIAIILIVNKMHLSDFVQILCVRPKIFPIFRTKISKVTLPTILKRDIKTRSGISFLPKKF